MKSTDNPPTERIDPTEKESGNSGASAPVGRQSNSDQLPSSLISSGQDAFGDITSKKENEAAQKVDNEQNPALNQMKLPNLPVISNSKAAENGTQKAVKPNI